METQLGFKKNIGRLMSGMAVYIFVTQYVCGLVLLPILQVSFPTLFQSQWVLLSSSIIINYIIGFPCFWLIIRKIPTVKLNMTPMKPKFIQVLRWISIAFALLFAFNLMTIILTQIIAAIKSNEVVNPLEQIIVSNNKFTVILFGAIVGPILEELVFRKVFYDKTAQYGEKLYIIISAFCFAMFHVNFLQIFYAFSLGAMFAYVYAKTRNILYTIILHIIINSWGLVVAPAMTSNIVFTIIGSIVFYAIVITGFICLLNGLKKVVYRPAIVEIPERPILVALKTFGSISYIILCVIIILILLFI